MHSSFWVRWHCKSHVNVSIHVIIYPFWCPHCSPNSTTLTAAPSPMISITAPRSITAAKVTIKWKITKTTILLPQRCHLKDLDRGFLSSKTAAVSSQELERLLADPNHSSWPSECQNQSCQSDKPSAIRDHHRRSSLRTDPKQNPRLF